MALMALLQFEAKVVEVALVKRLLDFHDYRLKLGRRPHFRRHPREPSPRASCSRMFTGRLSGRGSRYAVMDQRFMDHTETQIRQLLSEIAAIPQDASATANLYLELGVASVHALQLLSGLETRFGVAVPDDEFVEASSIEQLTALMNSLARSGMGSNA
jgi:acyl carrier protein